MTEPVYKIMTEEAYAQAEEAGHFEGSADDRRDGFIHLSAKSQVEGTLAKHFAGELTLVLLAIDVARLGPALKWEPSRGGELFPHLYGPLDLAAVLYVEPLPLSPEGRHILPDEFAP
jgi:uncharacterized protein (DUF952 family)